MIGSIADGRTFWETVGATLVSAIILGAFGLAWLSAREMFWRHFGVRVECLRDGEWSRFWTIETHGAELLIRARPRLVRNEVKWVAVRFIHRWLVWHGGRAHLSMDKVSVTSCVFSSEYGHEKDWLPSESHFAPDGKGSQATWPKDWEPVSWFYMWVKIKIGDTDFRKALLSIAVKPAGKHLRRGILPVYRRTFDGLTPPDTPRAGRGITPTDDRNRKLMPPGCQFSTPSGT